MAESLDDGEFWLPPQFLTDDDLLFDKKKANCNPTPLKGSTKDVFVFGTETNQFATEDLFPLQFPYSFDICGGGMSSDFSSPVDSAVGSAEHSDEEDLLTCKMARSDFHEIDVTFCSQKTKGWAASGSPQSTLCEVGRGCRCRKLSSRSPNQCPKVSSPASTWDLLHAAAGEVARMTMVEEGCIMNSYDRGKFGPPKKPSTVAVHLNNSNPDLSYLQQQSVACQKLQAVQFPQLMLQQMTKQQGIEVWAARTKGAAAVFSQQKQVQPVVQARGRNIGRSVDLSPSVWPPIQQAQHRQASYGMRAVFLANRCGKRERAGTGVFLPRQIGTPDASESRKKTASATVLLPAKVVQALKLDDGNQKPQLHRLNGTFHPGGVNAAISRNCNVAKRNHGSQPEFNSTEARLPQEWTY